MAREPGSSFQEHGVVLMKGVLDKVALTEAERCFDWSVEHPSPAAQSYYPDDGSRFYQDLFNTASWPRYRELVSNERLVRTVRDVMGCDDIWFFFEQVFLKDGGKTRRTPWHQDTSYFPVDGEDLAVVWLSLDPVSRDDALEFVRGSHRGTLFNGSSFSEEDDTAPLYDGDVMKRLPDIESDRSNFDIIGWDIEPGDAVIFHPSVLHGGGGTQAGKRRRTLSLRYFGNDCRFVERPQVSSQSTVGFNRENSDSRDISEFYEGLNPGDLFRHPDFLKVA